MEEEVSTTEEAQMAEEELTVLPVLRQVHH
jgi:hypothetical protein